MKVAIVGVSGAVGQEFLRVLDERNFPMDELVLLAHLAVPDVFILSVVNKLPSRSLSITTTSRESMLLLFRPVAVLLSNSRNHYEIWYCDDRQFQRIPHGQRRTLVVPEVNPEDALNRPRGIIANPNCTTIQMVVALKAIEGLSHIKRVHVSTYQAASGAGATAMAELVKQYEQLLKGEEPTVEKFAYQLAYNVIPHVDVFTDNGYTKEEMKMYNETRKIMHSDIEVSATCVRVPVMRAHSEATWVETERPVSVEEARKAFAEAEGVVLQDEPAKKDYPMPLFIAGKDPVYVGRIRKDITNPNGLTFWTVSDQIKKGQP